MAILFKLTLTDKTHTSAQVSPESKLWQKEWWQSCVAAVAANHPDVRYRLVLMKAATADPADMIVVED